MLTFNNYKFSWLNSTCCINVRINLSRFNYLAYHMYIDEFLLKKKTDDLVICNNIYLKGWLLVIKTN